MADLTITTQDDLPGPGDDRPYVMFVNQTEYGIRKFLRTNVLSARPDLKCFTSIRFHMTLKRHLSDSAGEIVLALLETIDLDPPLSVFCSDFHLEMESYPVEEGSTIEVPLLPLDQQRFARPHLLPELVLLKETLRQRTPEPWQQLIDRGGERVAATHQRPLWIRLGCSQSAWPEFWLRSFGGASLRGACRTRAALDCLDLRPLAALFAVFSIGWLGPLQAATLASPAAGGLWCWWARRRPLQWP